MKFRALTLAGIFVLAMLAVYPAAAQQSSQAPASAPAATTQAPAQGQSAAPAPTANTPVQGQDQNASQAPAATGQNYPSASQPADQNAGATPAAPSTPAATDDSKIKHDGGKDDVDAIGNRKMGGKGLSNWYSLEKEIAMGKQYAMQVESSVKLVQDPVVTEYVNRIGQNLVRNSDAKVPFTIKVIDSDEVNAFALPGGFFYVNSGLILAADNESELAGVMAHEIAHVAARHATRQMTRAQLVNFATIPLIFVPMGPGVYYGAQAALGLGLPLSFMHFQRGFEAEADYLGMQYMYKTGYDPQSFIAFFEKVEAMEKKKPGTLSKAFSTHPQTPDRINKSQEEMAKILPARQEYIVDTSEFAQVKARLAIIENRHKVLNEKDNENRPTLRRTTANDKTGTKDTGTDDRPTLKKRNDNN